MSRPSPPFLCCGHAESRKMFRARQYVGTFSLALITAVTRIGPSGSWLRLSRPGRALSIVSRAPARVLTRGGSHESRIAAMASAGFA